MIVVDCAKDDRDIDDPCLEISAGTFRKAWLAAIAPKFGTIGGFSVEVLEDFDSGDLMVALKQS